MTDTTVPISSFTAHAAPAIGVAAAACLDNRHSDRISKLLVGLRETAVAADGTPPQADARSGDSRFENQLALVRLGMATSLFYALRTKHAGTAIHSLRVALTCSAWAERLGLADQARDRIEVAALLHDLGKIGIPDRILRKPGKLTVDEQLTMDCCSELGCEILRGCTGDQELLDIVRYASTWFDCRRGGDAPRGDQLPLGARMLAIANAFDAMTTDRVYRAAMSRERAVQQLMEGRGTQFDSELTLDFSRLLDERPEMLQGVIVHRWLQQLRPEAGENLWTGHASCATGESPSRPAEKLFHQQLMNSVKDGVVFTDSEGTVKQWNHVMHRLTGIAEHAITGKSWDFTGFGFRIASQGQMNCPVAECLRNGSTVTWNLQLEMPQREAIPVSLQASPVVGNTPGVHGAVVVVRDLSDQADLQEKLETLHLQSTLDPLTGVANRSHFDATIKQLTEQAASSGPSFSLIICDIDHFKRVNDVHGHPAGDEALINFAAVLSEHSREGDLVARYGGEEFLLLAGNCDNATAANRAEAIRIALEKTPLKGLDGEAVTASFGVTEFQPGDSAETILSRADRALLKAKDNGRNRVVQLGVGKLIDFANKPQAKRTWLSWLGGHEAQDQNDVDIITPVPIELAVEKLRGFIADHNAEIVHVSESQLALKVNGVCTAGGRRRVDHTIALNLLLTLSELVPPPGPEGGVVRIRQSNTKVHVHASPVRNRDRRNGHLKACVHQLVVSLRSYLMGEVVEAEDV